MEAAHGFAHAGRVPRVVITGSQPHHLSQAEAHAWLRTEVGSLRALPGVESVVLTRARSSVGGANPWAWLCELHLADGADADAVAEHSLCRNWMGDLRLLGMHPALVVLDSGERVV